MALKLDDFMTEIRTQGIQHANRFQVAFDPPHNLAIGGNGLKGFLGSFGGAARSRQVTLRCRSVNFPGVTLMTKDDIIRYGYGPVDKTVHNALFGDITCNFIVDGKGLLQDYFNKWQMSIVNYDSSDTMDTVTHSASPYEVSYKDDYVTKITISQFDEKNNITATCIAQKAFPVAVGDLLFSWDANDEIIMLPVTFSYRDFKMTNGSVLQNLTKGITSGLLSKLL